MQNKFLRKARRFKEIAEAINNSTMSLVDSSLELDILGAAAECLFILKGGNIPKLGSTVINLRLVWWV